MSLDQNCKDRSYLYGRLLAIADKLESDTYGESDARLTNATRMQAAFAQHPGTTWMILSNKLTPYKQRLMKQNPAALHRYERLIRAILDDINVNDPERNRPLDDRYVLGYSHQYAAFYRKNETPAEAPAEPTEPADPAVTE